MLTKIISAMITSFNYTQMHFHNFIQKNFTKISAMSMVVKIFLVAVIFGLLPTESHAETYTTAVKLDTNSPAVLVGKDRQVSIESGISNFDAKKRAALRGQIAYARYSQSPSGIENYIGLYKDAAARYGIPWQILAAVHYVESGASGSTDRASGAGARGPMQFMPGTWRAYGVDGDGDGVADSCNVNDAVYGAANLLAASGAADGNVDAALYNYNHAQWYVNKVKNVAASIQ